MFYFRQEIDTIDTISPMPGADRADDLPQTLHAHLALSVRADSHRNPLRRLIGWLEWRITLRRSRLALLELTEEQLRDIGVRRAEAEKEARKVRFHFR